ncbi:MAG: LysR family transcriptional regulator [Pseudomonadota bacterium]|nr:LysR family transcriptional regulator [Pseudomonadota bacterium]
MNIDTPAHGFATPDLDQERLGLIAAFVSVVDAGSFAAAADQLRQTPSTISRKVLRLEERLGVRLLNRTTRKLALTEAGRVYLGFCRSISELLSTADAELSAFSAAPTGVVRLSVPVAFGQRHLTKLIGEFLKTYPRIEVEAVYSDDIADMISDSFDLSIRIGKLSDSSLVARKLKSIRRYLVASPDYIAAHGQPATPADLADHDCIRYLRYRSAGYIWRFERGDDATCDTTVNVRGSFRCDNSEAVHSSALAGGGIGIVSDYICYEALAQGTLVRLLPEWNVMPESGIYACWPGSRALLPKVRLLVDFLSDRIQRENWSGV